ncbi:MAG: rhodanese-like domain-containing protein, partial [Desulfobacterales bacterium]|nr:rhodanese-like domain-containing protein [Desulfobacterales bacterium]
MNKKNQDRLWMIFGIITLIGFAIFMAYPSFSASNNTLPNKISNDLAYQKYEKGVFVLDVRDPEEWAEYHIPNTTLIPVGELEARVNEIPFDQEVLVICSHGFRSKNGRDILLAAGHTQVS